MRYYQSFTSKVIILVLTFLLPVFLYAKNTPPKVDAGVLIRVIYPATKNATLIGSGSDAEGPVTFQWMQLGGNSVAKIAKPTNATTLVSNLKPGLYTFVLSATDIDGVIRRDTTNVTVLEKLTWTTLGKFAREVVVHPPTGGSGPAPVIFAFHGHGGTDSGFAQRAFELFWPEAIVVYPQGLRTLGSENDPNCKQAGWQHSVGEINCRNNRKDQDLQFFDSILVTLKKKYSVNTNLIFAHGWSNGADFVYNVLWPARANNLAGISPAGGTLDTIAGKKPMPLIHVAGTLDVHALYTDQQQSALEVRILNQCSPKGTVWATGKGGLLGTHYDSPINDPVVFLQYDGDHSYPFTVPPLIVRFFKEVAGVSTMPLITKASPMNKHLSSK